jgi:hypothetical protein
MPVCLSFAMRAVDMDAHVKFAELAPDWCMAKQAQCGLPLSVATRAAEVDSHARFHKISLDQDQLNIHRVANCSCLPWCCRHGCARELCGAGS